MKKAIILLLILFIFSSLVYAENVISYEPYTTEEFPDWAHKLRRSEIIFFGALALAFPLTVFSYNLAVNSFNAEPINDPTKRLLIQFGAAAAIAFTISITDLIIGEISEE